tara:strand:- start:1631 stop:3094 length:1464 start_codon:yes stop_codon:yes gene_type:complete
MNSYFRKVGFGLSHRDTIPDDPLEWATNQFNNNPTLSWSEKLPTVENQRERFREFIFQDDILRKKFGKKSRLEYEKEKNKLRTKTGEKFFHSYELSIRHHNALNSGSPTFERMWHFWGNHFSLSEKDFLSSWHYGPYMREVIRPSMSQTFEEMVVNVSTSWAMIHHLDNDQNIGPNSQEGRKRNSDGNNRRVGLNENHARELLELHTISPSAGYTQQDVIEMAKVLTGWSKKWSKKNLWAGPIGFLPEKHEMGQKKILGKIYNSKENKMTGNKQLFAVIKDLCNHKSCKEFIAMKLCQHFITDEPNEEMINVIVRAWEKSDGFLPDIHKATMKIAFEYGNQYKKFLMPETWLIQNAKILNFKHYSGPDKFIFRGMRPGKREKRIEWILEDLGHSPFRASQPNGFIDREDEWTSPELIIRRLVYAKQFLTYEKNIKKENASIYDNNFFENIIYKNFDNPRKTLELVNKANSTQNKFVIFANSPEMLKV